MKEAALDKFILHYLTNNFRSASLFSYYRTFGKKLTFVFV